jgi:hypothetical protein
MGEKQVRNIRVELSDEEYKALKGYAEKNNLKTKTYTEFLLRNIIRESKSKGGAGGFFRKFKDLF